MNEQLKIVISAEIDKLKKNIKEGTRLIDKFGKDGEKVFSEFNDGIQKAGDVAKKGLAVAGAAIVGATTALLGMTAATSEYRQQMGTLVSAFETAGGSAAAAKDTYNDLYRVLGDSGQATEAAQHLAKLTTEEQALSEWTNICQGVYAQFSDSLAIEGLTEAVNHTAKLGEVQGTLADALEWSGVSIDGFNEQLAALSTEADREALIRETLNGLYSESAANYEENNAAILAQNEANAKMTDSMAKIGEAMAPVNTALTELGAEILAQLTPYITDFAENYLPSIKEALSGVGDAIGKVITWIADNWELVSTLAAIITGIAIALSVFSTVMGIVNAVMMASSVTWIVLAVVAAIAALVAIIVVIIKYWDEIQGAAEAAWNKIKEVWNIVATWFMDNVVTPLVNFFSGLWEGIANIFKSIGSWFSNVFKSAADGIKNAFSSIGSFFSNIWSKITGVFSKVGSWFSDKFKAAVDGIKKVFNSISSFFSGIWESIKSIFSKVGSAIGGAITNTVKSAINGVLSTAIKIINGFISAINIAISVINAIPGVSLKKLSKLSVPKLAKGGVVDSATLAVIGEQGKEAVVPLENNTEWIDMLATRLNKGNSKTPIILQVDGKTFAQMAVSTINDLTTQTGSLPLKLA